ncbi:type II toxin-antitoxin system VapB family antitoxin [Geminicoccus flavidas]|uniref:type II toxin-antitoxin system VapB family antitoxin n=1 Tax=Geminicoccus flavidas TaxID=2506407 RepID=UPI001356C5CF|nr:type II toxin-antitoxin system VapB family antitoxin [Geminicoccus flavidas]
MRTNIDIDDALLAEAARLTGLPTKKAVVEEALRRLVRQKRQAEALRELTGIGWEGDLDVMRTDRSGHGPWGTPHSDEPPST